MAMNQKTMEVQSSPKNIRQGDGKNTKYAKTSGNNARKPYRGQGK